MLRADAARRALHGRAARHQRLGRRGGVLTAASKDDVRRFWQEHPLGSYAIAAPVGSRRYFDDLEALRRTCSQFALDFYRFEASRGWRVLDVGCGPGWVARRYAEAGARVTAVDLTQQALGLARRWLAADGLPADYGQADAECLPFQSEAFDWVSCDGVLHHTPRTEAALAEIRRVLRPGGGACISVYHENILLRRPLFPVVRLALRLLGVRMHGAGRVPRAISRADFVRWYDGVDNPLGKFWSAGRAAAMLDEAGLRVERRRVYYFPARFLPGGSRLPGSVLRRLDGWFGTMIFFEVRRPEIL